MAWIIGSWSTSRCLVYVIWIDKILLFEILNTIYFWSSLMEILPWISECKIYIHKGFAIPYETQQWMSGRWMWYCKCFINLKMATLWRADNCTETAHQSYFPPIMILWVSSAWFYSNSHCTSHMRHNLFISPNHNAQCEIHIVKPKLKDMLMDRQTQKQTMRDHAS